ncbi:MAG: SMP-30/gluconolactonase/LRE family protein [Arenibacterium sp.]
MTLIYDDRACELGEGPLWHPERQQLFWFDITGQRLLTVENGTPAEWHFNECVSAAGWVDETRFLIASETALFLFDLQSGKREHIVDLEADNPATRSNDGRADPWGGFWIGTMGKAAQPGAGAIYRYYRGELRKVVAGIMVPNAISFPPHGSFMCYTDSPTHIVMRLELDEATGWPVGEATPWLDLSADGLIPDGAVFDEDGNFWVAQWGAARVAGYDKDGQFLRAYSVPGQHSSCPAFGGADMRDLFCTSARQGLSSDDIAAIAENGMTFYHADVAKGQSEARVIL